MPAGRKHASVEYFGTLKRLSRIHTSEGFARACGKKSANVSAYLSGKKVPRDSALRSATSHLFEWNLQPILEIAPCPTNLAELPSEGGLYILYDSAGEVIYVGKASSLQAEIRQTLKRKLNFPVRLAPVLKKVAPTFGTIVTRVSVYSVPSSRLRHNLEALLQRVFPNQLHNANVGSFK